MNAWSGTIGAILCLAWSAFASAADLPSGEAVRKAVEARRGQSPLSKLAASMAPGTWAELKTEMPQGLWTSPPPSRGLHIAGWTDDAHWDSLTGQFLYMGLRQTRQFIAYSEERHAWRVIPLDRESDNPVFQTAFGHIYGRNAFDAANGRFFHMYGSFQERAGGVSWFDVATEKWTRLPPNPRNDGMSIEWFAARNGLVAHTRDRVWFYDEPRREWDDLGKIPVCGYHSLARHNPYREEVLFAGGNDSRRTVVRLKKDGSFERLPDAPVDLTVRSDKIVVDPGSGRYLILRSAERKLYEFDSATGEYRLADDFAQTRWPFRTYEMPVVAFVPEHDVALWADRTVWLYKHKALGDAK